ncbi:MAG: peptidoglycan binding protein CsiV [Gammaproteobacteria bacterium]|nr:peptidoglycan binding protein CsiV [Gammaproteobacteria bacterium]MDH3767316.1 peptidoglycan binding protein CsiV [Gammaproteobacteria bacterium]
MKARHWLSTALLVFLSFSVTAEDEEPVQFDVEMIVFRHLAPDDSEPQIDRVEEEDPDKPRIRRRRFTPLTSDQLRLGSISKTLLSSRDWSPVLHYGWRQPAFGRVEAPAVSLAGNRRGAYASGSARLSVERFLRLELDLQMDPGTGVSYTLDQARRMRSGEIHYFDHPQFGVIALVSRAE